MGNDTHMEITFRANSQEIEMYSNKFEKDDYIYSFNENDDYFTMA